MDNETQSNMQSDMCSESSTESLCSDFESTSESLSFMSEENDLLYTVHPKENMEVWVIIPEEPTFFTVENLNQGPLAIFRYATCDMRSFKGWTTSVTPCCGNKTAPTIHFVDSKQNELKPVVFG